MSCNESIYNLVPKEYVTPAKPPMYHSKFNPKSNPTGSTFGCFGANRLIGAGSITKKSSATLGPAKTAVPNPKVRKVLLDACPLAFFFSFCLLLLNFLLAPYMQIPSYTEFLEKRREGFKSPCKDKCCPDL